MHFPSSIFFPLRISSVSLVFPFSSRTFLSRSFSSSKSSSKLPSHKALSFTPEVLRLERILSNRGVVSRKEATLLIKHRKVKVNGEIVRNPGSRFRADVEILVNDRPIEPVPKMLVYHKPVGIQCTYDDPWKRPDLSQLKEKYPIFHHLHPVGRLDADSSGLLLFSRDGSITQHLLNPKKKVEREYDCLVLGAVHYDNLRDLLKKGVNTSEGIFPATLTEATVFSGKEDLEYLKSLVHQRNETLNVRNLTEFEDKIELAAILAATAVSLVRLSVTEGKYRMVRRILHNAGHSVCFLRRRRYGMIVLHPLDPTTFPSQAKLIDIWPMHSLLKEDEYRCLTEEELNWVKSIVKMVP